LKLSSLPDIQPEGSGLRRYAKAFDELRKQDKKAFIPFTLLGWPNAQTSFEMIEAMIEGGATMLELGFAFSDPAADGPIIQQAAVETLASGFSVDDALGLIRKVRDRHADIPIGLLVYYNMVLARSVDAFFKDVAKAGVDGVLIADLPPEMAEEVLPAAHKAGIDLIFIVSPLTSDARLKIIGEQAGGFLYVVSRLGITGTEDRYDTHLQSLLSRITEQCSLPACVGFGISTPEQAAAMAAHGADGVITGSKVIQLMREQPGKTPAEALTPFIRSMVKAVSSQ
jgi:tryptophan synthase alpha chain